MTEKKRSSSKASTSHPKHTPVVASLPQIQHPYSSIAISPNKQYAVTGCKDTLQILAVSPAGLTAVKTIPIAQHFQTNVSSSSGGGNSNMGRIQEGGSVLDSFFKTPAAVPQHTLIHVVVTDVAWSFDDNISAAGSNGVIVVWQATSLIQGLNVMRPQAVLSQHVRAVNRLAWHPTRPGLLLSASQDGTVRLWEQSKTVSSSQESANTRRRSRSRFLFGSNSGQQHGQEEQSFAWRCRVAFEPRSEAVRDIRWSPFYGDVFALVTSSGSLVVYNMYVKVRAIVKLTAHSGDATTLDWHPKRPTIVATGGASDRCVKVWDLRAYLVTSANSVDGEDGQLYQALNAVSVTSRNSSDGSYPEDSGATVGSLRSGGSLPRGKGDFNKHMLHVLSISASVTRLRWRPSAEVDVEDDNPFGDSNNSTDDEDAEQEDRHASMMAVATAPIKGVGAGLGGMLALWSFHRPYMALAVVEGHKEGAITDFEWLDTPRPDLKAFGNSNQSPRKEVPTRLTAALPHEADVILYENSQHNDDGTDQMVGIWQHVLSVGRDGRCLIQSFARGDQPIKRVPRSCFAMANLSPFQKGYGSLQIFSVCQKIPSGARSEFLLTGLRKDSLTARAPGVFREVPSDEMAEDLDPSLAELIASGTRLPDKTPNIVFNVVDQGDLDERAKPVGESQRAMVIAPEVVHLSRFASSYRLHPDDHFPSRVALCEHNADVAEQLNSGSLAHMWRMIASLLQSAGIDGLPDDRSQPVNVMQFVLLPTLRSLLEERANAGDVQTCVALCEVLQVVRPDQTVRIPGLEINLVREWYLSYIDLLRDMCLFSFATELIRRCVDPYICALNQNSTTIHESCPHCGKALEPSDGVDHDSNARRCCKSCRRRVGLCFLCHEPVKGVYVWCPGCGHGGHIDHALEWFRGLSGTAVREVCPTGCGHRCNLFRSVSAFPRTDSLRDLGKDTDTTVGTHWNPLYS